MPPCSAACVRLRRLQPVAFHAHERSCHARARALAAPGDRRHPACARTHAQVALAQVALSALDRVAASSWGTCSSPGSPGSARRPTRLVPGLACPRRRAAAARPGRREGAGDPRRRGTDRAALGLVPSLEAGRASAAFVAMGSLLPLNLIQWVAPYLSVSRVVTPPMATDSGILPAGPLDVGLAGPRVLDLLRLGRSRRCWSGCSPSARRGWPATPFRLRRDHDRRRRSSWRLASTRPLFRLTTKIPVVGRFRLAGPLPRPPPPGGGASSAAVAFSGLCQVARDEADRPSWRRLWPLALPPVLSVLVCLAPVARGSLAGVPPRRVRRALALVLAGPALIGVATALVASRHAGSRIALLALFVFAGPTRPSTRAS